MIKLVLVIGFLAVFGFVAYSIVLLLTKHFKEKEEQKNKPKNNQKK